MCALKVSPLLRGFGLPTFWKKPPLLLEGRIVSVMDIKQLGEKRYKEFEKSLRPGGKSLSGFIGVMESLDEVYQKNEQTIRELIDQRVDLEAIINKLEQITNSLDNQLSCDSGTSFNGINIKQTTWRGFQECPFEDVVKGCAETPDYVRKGYKDFTFSSPGGIVTIPGLAVHLLRKHKFMESEKVHYYIDLKKINEVFNFIKPK